MATVDISTPKQPPADPNPVPTEPSHPEPSKQPNSIQETPEWDWISEMPLTHVSFIIRCLMPEWHQLISGTGEFEKKFEEYLRRIQETAKEFPSFKIIPYGSVVEGLAPPPFFRRCDDNPPTEDNIQHLLLSRMQFMVEAAGKLVGSRDQDGYQYYIETEHTSPGYLRIAVKDAETTEPCIVHYNGNPYLSSSQIIEATTTTLDSVKEKLGKSSPDTDHAPVYSMTCSVWPKQASGWMTRSRPSGWPSEGMIREIVQGGCHVVPAAHHRSMQRGLEWGFSFEKAYSVLAQTLTTTQRQCYMMLMTFIESNLSHPKILTHFGVKNLFFTRMEKIPEQQWQDENNGLAAMFLYFIDELKFCFIDESLPHYFIPECNLLDHVDEDFCDNMMAKLAVHRQDIIPYILQFDKTYRFSYSPQSITFADVFQPFLENRKQYENIMKNNIMRNCKVAQYLALEKLGEAHIKETQFDYALSTFTEMLRYLILLNNQELGLSDLYTIIESKILSVLMPKQALTGYRFLMEKHPDPSASFWQNMACVYTSLYGSEQDMELREQYRQKADENFQKALNKEFRGTTIVDYTMLLRKCGRSTEAIPLLGRALVTEQELKTGNQYTSLEYISLDQHLRDELNDTEGRVLGAPALIFTLYLLIQCHLETNQKAMAVELMPDFEAACEKVKNNELAFSLLGHCFYDLGNYDAAIRAFKRSEEIKPDYRLASNNILLCQAMALSLES